MQAVRLLAITAAVWAGCLQVAMGQAPDVFYKGRTITIVVGFGVGGNDDIWARLVARHLPAHMPGKPQVLASNVPGAGSLVAANQIYNSFAQDGTFVALVNRGVLFEPLLGGTGIHFDPLKLGVLGSPDLDTPVCEIRSDAAVKQMSDLQTQEFVVGSTGSGSDSQTYPAVIKELLNVRMKIVQGYPGSREIMLATERGEVQGGCFSYDTVARDPMIQDKRAHILFQAALTADPRLPGVPSIADLAGQDTQRDALNLFLQRTRVGRPFVLGPKVPPDRVAALQAAFRDTLADPAFVDEAKALGLNPRYVPPEQIATVLKDAYASPPSVVLDVKKALGRS